MKKTWHEADNNIVNNAKNTVKYWTDFINNNPGGNYENNLKNAITDSQMQGWENQKKNAADTAKEVYNQLRNSGFSGYADKLSNMNDKQAKKYVYDISAKTGKQEIRPYMYNKGSKYGLTQNQIDDLIKYDNDTQEVSFNGKALGIANDNNVDGHTYWDTEILDKAFDDYIAENPNLKSDDMRYNENNDDIAKRSAEQWDMIKQGYNTKNDISQDLIDKSVNTSIYDTPQGQDMLKAMGIKENAAWDSGYADGAIDNSGNLDSFSVANAQRNAIGVNALGYQLAKQESRKDIDLARGILADMGVQMAQDYSDQRANIEQLQQQNQLLFDNNQTKQNEDASRLSEISKVTGKVPTEYQKTYNPFYNSEGKLENPNIDYGELYKKYKAEGNDEMANYAAYAKADKINNYGYGKYADTLNDVSFDVPDVADVRENDKDRQHEKNMVWTNADAEKSVYKFKSDVDDDSYVKRTDVDFTYSEKGKNNDLLRSKDYDDFSAALNYKYNKMAADDDYIRSKNEYDYKNSGNSSSGASSSSGTTSNSKSNTYSAEKDSNELTGLSQNARKFYKNQLNPYGDTMSISALRKEFEDYGADYDLTMNDYRAITTAVGASTDWLSNFTLDKDTNKFKKRDR